MENIKVSVIVPIFNAEKYLPTCIQSIMGQTLKEIEIILVDDGSTDKSLEICKEYAEKDSRIKVVIEINGGVSVARNTGLKVAKGEYIGFVDADDWIQEEMYESMYEKASLMEAEVALCNYVKQPRNRRLSEGHHIEKKVLELKQDKQAYIGSLLAGKDLMGTDYRNYFRGVPVYLYKQSLIERLQGTFNSKLAIGEDFLFNIQVLSKANKIAINNGGYYYYRTNQTSTTQRYRKGLEKEHELLIGEIEKALQIEGLKDKLTDRLITMRLLYLIKNVKNEAHKGNTKKYKEKVKNIKKMCSNDQMKKVLEKYNTRELSVVRKIWFMLYRCKCGNILYLYYHYIAND